MTDTCLQDHAPELHHSRGRNQAVYDKTAGDWVLYRMNNGVKTSLDTYGATFSSTTTYHVSLDMNGSTIRLLVDGTQRGLATDSTITAAGRAGVTMGFNGAYTTTVDNSNGMHLDNFTVSTSLADSWGTNTGTYLNEPTLGVAGALAGDSNTAVTFDGGYGSNSTWSQNAGLVDADVSGTSNDFGVSLASNGYVVAGVGGGSNMSIMSASSGYDDGTWHHVVFTRTKSSGALRLYVDSGSAVTGTGSTVSLTSPANINFGRIQSGSSSYYYTGSLDEVAVYNTALSAATVTAHYTAGN